MTRGGKAWRGYFKVGDEYTSGLPDQKEGLYFGTHSELETPKYLHGKNLYPQFSLDGTDFDMTELVDQYMGEMRRLGTILSNAIFESLSLDSQSCSSSETCSPSTEFSTLFDHPTELFRIFNYPPHDPSRFEENTFGVGTHTDYGYLTLLRQDLSGGLQVQLFDGESSSEEGEVKSRWVDADPVPNTFVVNLGDALERLTGGLYLATPHRVALRKGASSNRLSFPYFFDPDFDLSLPAPVFDRLSPQDQSLALSHRERLPATKRRWDGADPALFSGTYGQYLMQKVSKVFPELAAENLQT